MFIEWNKYLFSLNGNRIHDAVFKRYNKHIIRPRVENQYVNSIVQAIKNGFRWIDYSCTYGDGKLLGKAIRVSGIKREDLKWSTIPIALCDAREQGLLEGNVLLAGFGVGLSWGATILKIQSNV